MPNKKASILLEVIVSIALLSLVMINAMLIYQEFYHVKKSDFQNEIYNIELLNTKYFLQKNIHRKTDINRLTHNHQTLYYEGTILLQNVSKYSVSTTSEIASIHICLDSSICKTVVLPL